MTVVKKYLKRDYTGAASLIEYGKEGDEVTVIRDGSSMALVECKGERFHVHVGDLSDSKVVGKTASIVKTKEVKKKK